jgi:hypothetical protein
MVQLLQQATLPSQEALCTGGQLSSQAVYPLLSTSGGFSQTLATAQMQFAASKLVFQVTVLCSTSVIKVSQTSAQVAHSGSVIT